MTELNISPGKKIMAWILTLCLIFTLIPELSFAVSDDDNAKQASSEEAAKENVIDKSETTTTYSLGGGEEMMVFHGGEVRYKDETGKLVDYDPSLVSVLEGEKTEQNESLDEYAYKNRQGDRKQYMPDFLSEQTPVILENNSYRIEITPSSKTIEDAGLADSTVKIESETVPTIYEDEATLPINAVYGTENKPAVFKYTSGEAGIKETIILNEKPESNVFEYKINTGRLKAKKNVTNEGITFYDEETDDIVAAIAPPWMNDDSGEAYSEEITYDLKTDEEEDGSYILTMTVDEGYLDDKARKYPVTIDPTTTWTGSSKVRDVYVISGTYKNTNFYESGTVVMPAGKNSTGTHETYIQFVNLKSTISGKNVTAATFSAYEVSGGANGQKVGAFKVTGSWSPSTLTYSNKPACASSAMSSITTQPEAVEHKFNVASYARGVAGGTTDRGIALKNTTASPSYAVFFGSRHSTTSYKPKLKVTYSETPPAATSAKVSPAYVKNSTSAKLTFTGLPASSLQRVEYKITAYDDAAGKEGAVVKAFGENTAITSGGALPALEPGCYKVYVRGVNSAGTAGAATSAGILHVDKTAPALEALSLKSSSGTGINGKWTGEANPVIGFSGIKDSHITTSCISYAIAPKGLEPAAADFKTPADISISSSQPYSGTFRLTTSDRSIASGDYTIHVKASDQAGNSIVKRLSYKKDNEDPEGSITLIDLVTGNEVTKLYKPVNIEVGVSGTGSDIAESSLKLYKAVTDSTGKVTGIDKATEKVISKNFTISENIVMDTIDICDSYGKYRLVLYLKDSVGRTKEVTKDFEVTYTLPAPDKVQIAHSKGGKATMTWGFTYTPQQKIKLGTIEGKFSGEKSFKTLVPAGENGTLPFDGSAEITVPDTEGEWDVVVRGKSKSGHAGEEITVKCVVDRTAPVVKDILFNQCYLQGTITDDNLKEWRVYAKEKTAASYVDEPVSRGTNTVQNYLIAFIDMGNEPFEPGKEYTLKIVAEDKAGNTTQKVVNVTVPSDNTIPRLIEAQLKIDKGDSNTPSQRAFIYGTDRNELSVEGNVQGVDWYIANRKASPALKDADGNALYDEMGWWDILALKKETDGTRKYSVPVMENGYKNELSFTSDEISGNTASGSFYSHDPIVSFRIKASGGAASYQIRANAADEGKFVTVEPGKTYYITDITTGSGFANSFDIKVTASDGHTVNDGNAILFADTAVNEYFMYSNVEDFAPKRLSVEDKINYKTYLKWDIPDNLPDTVSYEVYRSTSEDFFPDESTLVASDIKAGYFTEINAWHGKEFYYKVCAVKKYTDPIGIKFESRSSFTEVSAGRAVDQNESVKRLGIKEFWEFAEFDTPNGNGYIEKSSGNFVYSQKDAELPNEDFNVELTRTYNSQSSSRGTFGLGWSHDYDIELINVSENNALDFTHVVLKDGNGTIYHFTRGEEDEHFISSFGSYVNLTAEPKEKEKTVIVSANGANNSVTLKYQFMLYTKDGLKYYFNSGGQLILMEESNGKFVIFEHEAKKGVLCTMRTNNNITVEFIYNDGKNGSDPLTVKEIKMPDGSKVQYEYTKPLMSSDRLLTKVTEVADGESIEYEYEYDRPILSSQPRNLTTIKEAQNKSKYRISYDFENDRVEEAVYPNGERFTFDYAEDNTSTITKKYSGGQAVIGEKDFFDRVYGRCEKSIRGVDDMSRLEGTDESGLDVTTYTYKDNQKISMASTAQYREIDSNGYVLEKNGIKENKASYSGDNPVKETEDDGTISEYTYYTKDDGAGLEDLIKTEKETNGDGKVTSYKKYSYDSSGNVTETIDYVEGTRITNAYYTDGDFKGELKSMQESLLTVNDEYDITAESVKSTSQYSYEYGEDGSKRDTCIQTVPKADGTNEVVTTSQEYDIMGRLVKDTDSRGYQTISTYDGFGRETAVTYKYTDSDKLKSSTAKAYDKNGMVTYEKLEDGIEKWYTYDNMGQVTSTRVKKGENYDETINTSYRYQNVDIYQGKGNKTVSVKNAYVTKEAYADGTIISETYEDHNGNVVRAYQNGLYTDMTYDSQGEMITKWLMGQTLSGTEGLLELYIYDDKGNLTATVTDPDYKAAAGTTGYKVKGDSVVTRSRYDSDGNAIEQIDALGNTTKYGYDKTGDLISVTLPDEVKYEYQYDVKNDGFTTKDVVIEPREVKTGETTASATAKSIVVKDNTDRTIKVEDLGTNETDGISISTSYEYDIRDNLIKATEKNGNYKAYTYDVRNRLTAIDYYENTDGSAAKTLRTEFTYDDSDNMTSMTDKRATGETVEIYRYKQYGYDGFNRLVSVSECDTDKVPDEAEINANKISYTYDGKDRLTAIDYPNCSLGAEGLRFAYNIHGWLTAVKAVKKGGGERTVREYAYTDDGKVAEITDYTDFTSGLTGTSKWLKRTYTYDKLNRPIKIEYTDNMSGSSSTVKESHIYEYDKNNNIISEDVVDKYGKANSNNYGELRDYAYDVNNRLIESGIRVRTGENELSSREAHTYEYDSAGNKTGETAEMQRATRNEPIFEKQYSYNEFNQLTHVTGTDYDNATEINKAYAYDANGNQIKETDSVTGKETHYVYDADNRLKTAVGKNGTSVEYTQENQYNGFGQRVEKKEGTEETNYFYDGTAVLYTKDKANTVTAFNLIGAEDNILTTARPGEESTGDVSFYTYTKDIRESTMNIIGADGISQVSYEYDDFGETTVYDKNKDKPFYNEICYTAGVYDKTTGLYNLNARYYDPENGSFLTQDTYRGSRSRTETLNLYTYCAGNPISYTDPSGHWIGSVLGAAMGAYDGYKYAQKKNLKGWKKGAAILGGAALGVINPFKVVKAVKTGYKAYKATKYGKKAASALKKAKTVKRVKAKPKITTVTKKSTKAKSKPKVIKQAKQTAKKQTKRVKAACFTAGTKVHTKDGFKSIESVKAGDYVWSENPETHEKALKKVKKIFVREKDSIIRLSINGETIETTTEHPFYVEGKGFVEAKNLKVGDEVRTEEGTAATVDRTENVKLDKPVEVYNFEVEDFHTYYVSGQKALVHNTCATTTKNVKAKASVLSKSGSARKTESKSLVSYYPTNNGAVAGTEKRIHLMAGDRIDRYGGEKGKYFSPVNTPVDMRALPPSADTSIYTQYEVVKPFEVEASTIAPAFGKPGGGVQYRSPVTVEILLKRGIIKEIGR